MLIISLLDGHSEMAPPDPIPNSAVKRLSANGSAVCPCESRSPSSFFVNDTFIGKDNTVVAFKKKNDYVITARKEGCIQASVGAAKSFDATTLLGILIDFGLISILVVDGLATGAWQSFDQTSYVVDPNCS